MANENNKVKLMGRVAEEPVLSHRVYGEGFYKTVIAVERLSGACDMVPVTVSERLLMSCPAVVGEDYFITGQFRSYNNYSDTGSRLKLTVFAKTFCPAYEGDEDEPNDIFLDGYLCKEPVFRSTPFGREIADMLLAVNRSYGKSDYIPCITWGRTARYAANLKIGDRVQLVGRFRSRAYQKQLPDGTTLNKVAYEVSVSRLTSVRDEPPLHALSPHMQPSAPFSGMRENLQP